MTDKEYEDFATRLHDHMRNWKDEYILCAANWYDDGKYHVHQPSNINTGFVICGRRHHNIFMTVGIVTNDNMEKIKYLNSVCEQGFITNKDRWVNRKEAAELATKSGQIAPVKPMDEETKAAIDKMFIGPPIPPEEDYRPLFSEDLY